jgi:hypothetical protein
MRIEHENDATIVAERIIEAFARFGNGRSLYLIWQDVVFVALWIYTRRGPPAAFDTKRYRSSRKASFNVSQILGPGPYQRDKVIATIEEMFRSLKLRAALKLILTFTRTYRHQWMRPLIEEHLQPGSVLTDIYANVAYRLDEEPFEMVMDPTFFRAVLQRFVSHFVGEVASERPNCQRQMQLLIQEMKEVFAVAQQGDDAELIPTELGTLEWMDRAAADAIELSNVMRADGES